MILIPRRYQEEGISFLKSHKRAMLADAPGLGKTLQASMAAVKPVLIAAPTYLTEQWYDFIREQFPKDSVKIAQGTYHNKMVALAHRADWTIVNIEMLRSYTMPKVTTFIIDESHHVRGRDSQQSLGALRVAVNADYIYLLTATPICNEPDDLYMQFQLISPEDFPSYYKFIEQYCNVYSTPWGNKVRGAKDPKRLFELMSKYGISRGYKDVGLELPPLIENRIMVKPTNEFMKTYKKLKESYNLDGMQMNSIAEAMQTLRRMTACKEKTDALMGVVEDQTAKESAVVFCWYKSSAEHLGKLLKAPVITGDTAAKDRRIIANKSHIVVATLASLSEGVDLSSHKVCIFFEEDYTPGIMYQALSRVRRHSADNRPVRSYTIMVKGTVDETVHSAVTERISNVREILRRALV